MIYQVDSEQALMEGRKAHHFHGETLPFEGTRDRLYRHLLTTGLTKFNLQFHKSNVRSARNAVTKELQFSENGTTI